MMGSLDSTSAWYILIMPLFTCGAWRYTQARSRAERPAGSWGAGQR